MLCFYSIHSNKLKSWWPRMIHSSGLTSVSWKMSGGGTYGERKTKVGFDIDCENSSKLLYEIQVDFSRQTNRDPQWVLVYLWWMKKVQLSPGFPSVHRKLRWKENARCTSWLLLKRNQCNFASSVILTDLPLRNTTVPSYIVYFGKQSCYGICYLKRRTDPKQYVDPFYFYIHKCRYKW